MERVIRKDDFGNIACNNIIICSSRLVNLERNIKDFLNHNWKVIEPKYFRYRDDNAILEIWDNGKGILLSGNLKGLINDCWTSELREEITYKEAMSILEQEQNKDLGYNNKDLMSRVENELERKNKFFDDRKFPFWLKVVAGNDRPIGTIFYVKDVLTRYKKEDVELYTGYIPSFTEDDLIDKLRGKKKQYKQKDYILEDDKQNNNGGASDWYSLPKDANTLQDLIEHRNMNGSVKDIFKACYRLGIKTKDDLRDLNKMAYYSLREIGRISGRKDYVTIAKELMGSQTTEKE